MGVFGDIWDSLTGKTNRTVKSHEVPVAADTETQDRYNRAMVQWYNEGGHGPKPDLATMQLETDRSRVLATAAGYDPLIGQLQAQAAGKGPSVALDTYKTAADDATSRSYGMASSGNVGGGSRAALLNSAMMGAAQQNQQSARQAGIIRAQEQQAAQSQLGAALGQKAAVQQGLYAGTMNQTQGNQKVGLESDSRNQDTAEKNAGGLMKTAVGAAGAAGSAMMLASDIRAKEDVSAVEKPSDKSSFLSGAGAFLKDFQRNWDALDEGRQMPQSVRAEAPRSAAGPAPAAPAAPLAPPAQPQIPGPQPVPSLRPVTDIAGESYFTDPELAANGQRVLPDGRTAMAYGVDSRGYIEGGQRRPVPLGGAPGRSILPDDVGPPLRAPETQGGVYRLAPTDDGTISMAPESIVSPFPSTLSDRRSKEKIATLENALALERSRTRPTDLVFSGDHGGTFRTPDEQMRYTAARGYSPSGSPGDLDRMRYLRSIGAGPADVAWDAGLSPEERASALASVDARRTPLATAAGSREALAPVGEYSYRYKPEAAARIGADTAPRVGVMAQELAASPSPELRSSVVDTPNGLAIDGNRALSANLALAAGMDKRLARVEDALRMNPEVEDRLRRYSESGTGTGRIPRYAPTRGR